MNYHFINTIIATRTNSLCFILYQMKNWKIYSEFSFKNLQCEYKNLSPGVFLKLFFQRRTILNEILHAYCMIVYARLGLRNFIQLSLSLTVWQSYATLSATIRYLIYLLVFHPFWEKWRQCVIIITADMFIDF